MCSATGWDGVPGTSLVALVAVSTSQERLLPLGRRLAPEDSQVLQIDSAGAFGTNESADANHRLPGATLRATCQQSLYL